MDWLLWFWDDEPEDEEFDLELDEDDVLLVYALSFTAVPCFCTHAVTAELALLPPPMPPPPMPPPSWM